MRLPVVGALVCGVGALGILFFGWRQPVFEARLLLVPEVGQGVSPAEAVKGAGALAEQLAAIVPSGDVAAKVAAKDGQISAWLTTNPAGSWSAHVSARAGQGGVLWVRGRHADREQARRLAEGTARMFAEQGTTYLPVRTTVLLLDPAAPRAWPWLQAVLWVFGSAVLGGIIGLGMEKGGKYMRPAAAIDRQ